MKLENNPGKTGIVSMMLIKLLMKDIDGIPGPIRTHSYLDNVTWAFRRLFLQELLHTDNNNNNNKTLLTSRRWVCRECELNIYIYIYIYGQNMLIIGTKVCTTDIGLNLFLEKIVAISSLKLHLLVLCETLELLDRDQLYVIDRNVIRTKANRFWEINVSFFFFMS